MLSLIGTERHGALTVAGRAEKGTSTITSKADGKHSTKFTNLLTCHLNPCVMWNFLACYVEVIMFEMEASHDSPYILPVLS